MHYYAYLSGSYQSSTCSHKSKHLHNLRSKHPTPLTLASVPLCLSRASSLGQGKTPTISASSHPSYLLRDIPQQSFFIFRFSRNTSLTLYINTKTLVHTQPQPRTPYFSKYLPDFIRWLYGGRESRGGSNGGAHLGRQEGSKRKREADVGFGIGRKN